MKVALSARAGSVAMLLIIPLIAWGSPPAAARSIPDQTEVGQLTYRDLTSLPAVSIRVTSRLGTIGVLTFTDVPPDTIVIQSASGCNGRVCIYTEGVGLRNTAWGTTAKAYYADGRLCPSAYLYAKPPNRSTYALYDAYLNPGTNCHRAPNQVGAYTLCSYYTPLMPQSFVNQTKQCTAWEPNPPLNGFPCVTVHS